MLKYLIIFLSINVLALSEAIPSKFTSSTINKNICKNYNKCDGKYEEIDTCITQGIDSYNPLVHMASGALAFESACLNRGESIFKGYPSTDPNNRMGSFKKLLYEASKDCKKFKHLSISGHGNVGYAQAIGLTTDNVEKELKGLKCVMAPKAEITFLSCTTGGSCEGRLFMNLIAKHMLPAVGQIHAEKGETNAAIGNVYGPKGEIHLKKFPRVVNQWSGKGETNSLVKTCKEEMSMRVQALKGLRKQMKRLGCFKRYTFEDLINIKHKQSPDVYEKDLDKIIDKTVPLVEEVMRKVADVKYNEDDFLKKFTIEDAAKVTTLGRKMSVFAEGNLLKDHMKLTIDDKLVENYCKERIDLLDYRQKVEKGHSSPRSVKK